MRHDLCSFRASVTVQPADLDLTPLVQMREATRVFGEVTAADHVSLDVSEGTILGLIGPSGSGKTTLIRMLTGTVAPSSGEVRVLGEDPRRFRRETRERIGYLPQDFLLYRDLTAAENVSFVAALFGMFWPSRRRRTREVLELVQLWDARRRLARDMSGGMRRRLALACALVHDPAVLFLDEPTAGIDPLLRQMVWEELRRLRDGGRTLLVTTQYVGEAQHCDTVALLSDGQLIALDHPDRLVRRALGGDLLEVVTKRPIDPRPVRDLRGIQRVEQRSPERLRIVAEDGSAATPLIVDTITAHGGEVATINERRPTLDEVFALLVEDHRARNGDPEPAAP